MSRSGYSEDCENIGLYRGAVDRALNGKRGQAFLREMLVALDAMPVKELEESVLVGERGEVCAMGSVCKARGIDTSDVDEYDRDAVGELLSVAPSLAAEIAYENDECAPYVYDTRGRARRETPAERWTRMRAWCASNIRSAT